MSKLYIQEWVYKKTTPYEQAALISALRGMDIEEGNEITKPVVKMIRYVIGETFKVNGVNKYSSDVLLDVADVCDILSKGRNISKHWFDHFYKAIKVISKKHPNNYTRRYWSIVISNFNYRYEEVDTKELYSDEEQVKDPTVVNSKKPNDILESWKEEPTQDTPMSGYVPMVCNH